MTAGAALLVPDFLTTPVPARECAAITNPPGAEISGFSRPFCLGPEEEEQEIGNEALCASYEPTTKDKRPVEIDHKVCGGTGRADDDCAESRRSTHVR